MLISVRIYQMDVGQVGLRNCFTLSFLESRHHVVFTKRDWQLLWNLEQVHEIPVMNLRSIGDL
jgi:hypothetical protein